MSEYPEYNYTKSEATWSHHYTFPKLIRLLNQTENKTILDLGCGNGSLAIRLLEMGYNAYGIDASESGIQLAMARYQDRFFKWDINSDFLPAKIENIKFDTIISTEVIEHLYSPQRFISTCKNILTRGTEGGSLILTTPYHGYLKNLLLALSGKFDSHFTVLWEGGHIKFFSKKTIFRLMENIGFTDIKFYGAGRIPSLWKSMIIKGYIKK